ncbi:Cysteine-rich secretory protein family protein [Ulvibacter sp. MAR_2010_11]|uniref:CAP domain-containing protein n=1 Tax=Ulvibacter sp. MAR_2010_11 TaxID=1250229 RepID=UPI000C2C66FB|nr:CAP domain-containing protein [Ulvibacter sp. MAR_2010_11]PKA83027.1 Cysteine-rich secretory protein family protein [Ulvibacter sp. MAR_2010_11]
MNLLRTGLLAMALMSLVTSCQKDEGVAPETANYTIDLNLAQETDWQMANEILVLVNEHRASIGLSAIAKDQQYASAYAVDHTQYMIDLKKISHDNFGIRSQALKQRGAEVVAENVAFGYATAEAVVTAWLHSDGHKGIIEGNYTHSGFGIMKSPEGTYYFTQLFYRK